MPPSGAGAVGSHADRELTKATQIGQLACQYLRFSQEKLKKKNVGLSGMLETLTQELSELQEQHAKRVSGAARHACAAAWQRRRQLARHLCRGLQEAEIKRLRKESKHCDAIIESYRALLLSTNPGASSAVLHKLTSAANVQWLRRCHLAAVSLSQSSLRAWRSSTAR